MEVSEVSNEEFVRLVSSYWYLADKNFNCRECKKQFSASVRDSRKACFTSRKKEYINYNDSIKYFTCPSNHFNQAYASIIEMNRLFHDGTLPFEGGLLDQPSKIIEMFRIVDSLDAERQKDIDRKQKWQKTQSKSNSRLTNKKP